MIIYVDPYINMHYKMCVCFLKYRIPLSSMPLKDRRAPSPLLRDLLAPRKSHPV